MTEQIIFYNMYFYLVQVLTVWDTWGVVKGDTVMTEQEKLERLRVIARDLLGAIITNKYGDDAVSNTVKRVLAHDLGMMINCHNEGWETALPYTDGLGEHLIDWSYKVNDAMLVDLAHEAAKSADPR